MQPDPVPVLAASRRPDTRGGARRRTAGVVAVLALTAAAVATGPGTASASSHREAPNIAGSPRLDNTDVYAFLSPDKPGTATLIANWVPFEEPTGGPNFYTFEDGARYEINVDTDGDAKPDVVYRWTFTTKVRNGNSFLYNTGPVTSLDDPDLNVRQTYTLQRFKKGAWTTIATDRVVAPSDTGDASFPNYSALRDQATYAVGGTTMFAGQADDPFFADLRLFNLLYGGNLSEVGNDTLRGYNVNSVALQVPVTDLGGPGNVVGIWSTTSARTALGDYKQVSRLGSPLVNEVVVGLKDKNTFNASQPKDDVQFLSYVTDPSAPKVLNAVYGLPVPPAPRQDLVQVFLTGIPGINQPAKVTPSEELRLNLTPFTGDTPSRLGVIGGDRNGFPNGRRLTDDVVDASLQVVAGTLVGFPNTLGDNVNGNDRAFGTSFPYLALPSSGSASVNTSASLTGTQPAALVSPLVGGRPDGVITGASLGSRAAAQNGVIASVLLAVAGSLGLLLTGRRRRAATTSRPVVATAPSSTA